MTREVAILIADGDAGHARLIEKNLQRVGLHNPVLRFENGQDILDFLFRRGKWPKVATDVGYLLLLDIRMPKVDGVEVLREIKADAELRKLPIIQSFSWRAASWSAAAAPTFFRNSAIAFADDLSD
jgi:CheY-like chemotaxis protein